MSFQEILAFVKSLVSDSIKLKNKYTKLHTIPANYACIFAHTEEEYQQLRREMDSNGKVARETEMGNIYQVGPFETEAGILQLIKIRKPEIKKHERGYVDFTVPDYETFKQEYLASPNFKLTKRANYEMISLADQEFDVRVYFAYPPIDQQLGLA